MSIALVTSGIIVAFTLGLWIGYFKGTQHVRQQAVDRKLASWKRIIVGHNTHSPIVIEKFTWVGEEQDG